MPTFRGNFSQLLAPGIQHLMFEWLSEHPEEFSQFLRVKPSERAYEDDQILGGLGTARKKPEGEGISYDDPIQGGTKRYIHDTYALGWQVTREMLQDDKYDIMQRMPRELAKSLRHTKEQVGASVLNLGFTTITTADGVSLFNTAHPLLDPSGGDVTTATVSNRLNPDAALSVTSLQNILILFENMVNERGLRMALQPSKLCIPPDLQWTAQTVLQGQFMPGTANNDINPMQGRLEPSVLHWLTDTNNWFVGSKDHNNAVLYERQRPKMDSWDDQETKSAKYSITERFSVGATDYRGWAGSAP